MTIPKAKYGNAGILLGGIALLLALVHFWAGPFSPQPSLETFVGEKAASIRQATIDALQGKEVAEVKPARKWDSDRLTQLAVAVLGGLAFILAILSFISHESRRVAGGAAILGVSAITFQFVAMYIMAFLVVMLIVAVLGSLGAG